jgi:hypothetical protein
MKAIRANNALVAVEGKKLLQEITNAPADIKNIGMCMEAKGYCLDIYMEISDIWAKQDS